MHTWECMYVWFEYIYTYTLVRCAQECTAHVGIFRPLKHTIHKYENKSIKLVKRFSFLSERSKWFIFLFYSSILLCFLLLRSFTLEFVIQSISSCFRRLESSIVDDRAWLACPFSLFYSLHNIVFCIHEYTFGMYLWVYESHKGPLESGHIEENCKEKRILLRRTNDGAERQRER